MADEKCVLIVRHLPSEFSTQDKEDFLKHFGAERVRCFGDRGRMKHVAFASFAEPDQAKMAMQRLHQLEVLGRYLSVELSNSQMLKFHPSICDTVSNKVLTESQNNLDTTKDTKLTEKKRDIVKKINSIAPNLGVNYMLNPKLHYRYPTPTVAILTNIANALASVPRFYVQVLHLMNKMNLPAPFGAVTQTPPIAEGAPPLPEGEPQERPAEPPESSSDAESELDGGEGGVEDDIQNLVVGYKRPARGVRKPRKRHKLQKIVSVTRHDGDRDVTTTKDLFEQPLTVVPKKIELKLPAAIAKTFSEWHPMITDQPAVMSHTALEPMQLTTEDRDGNTAVAISTTEDNVPAAEGGFGKIEPVAREQTAKEDEDDEEEEEWGASKFISSRRLSKGRLSRSEMRDLSVFKRFSPGEVTTRLYIKNLSKQTTKKDIHYIFGKYVNWDNEEDKLMFDIRLMKEGRMKGQAFVTLPSEQNAKDALNDTNGFVLNEKPLVVQFARSAKAKEVQTPIL